jgi:hypothetical protein
MSNQFIAIGNFQEPPLEYRPWTRWWWPGGAVEHDELLREVQLFAHNFFGGAEIQPFVAGIKRETALDPNSGISSYGSPEYYQKLVAVLEAAQELGLQIDLTLGSGWPAGGTFVPLEDNVNTLLYGEITVTQAVNMPVPPPIMPFPYAIFSQESILPFLADREWTKTLTYHPEQAKLVAVVAARITDNGRSPDPSILTDTLRLDAKTAVDITDTVQDGYLDWQPPTSGTWQVIAIYSMPSGSNTIITADLGTSYVVDPFDSIAIERYYDSWLGTHPELLAFAGKTLRALFSDSYEFFAQRLFAHDLISLFRERRGYDITPYLPAVFQPARDQWFFFFAGLRTAPDFSFGEVSKRIIYDYDLTISDLFFEHWYPASTNWSEKHNLQFRQQGYNPPLDVIKAAGAAHIPETEGGNELWLKRVASGAHLYGRSLISAEAFVFFPQGGFGLSPQDYKYGIDLLITAGVNHIIYHGTPYRWDEPGYGETGWSPFISPYGTTNISANISEADAFWKFQHTINQYVARLQTLLRQGNPDADLLVYLPLFVNPDDPRFKPALEMLDTSGYVWEWVNDELLTQATWDAAGTHIGIMTFQAIILPDVQSLPLATAESLAKLAQAGAPIIIFGASPTQQPGYFNYEVQDGMVANLSETIVAQKQSRHITDKAELLSFIWNLPGGKIRYETHTALRYIRRTLDDGSSLAFIRNTKAEATTFSLIIDSSLQHGYWFDALTGNVYAAQISNGKITGWLAGFGSIAFFASPTALYADDELQTGNPVAKPIVTESIPLTDWTLEITGDDVPNGQMALSGLGDWSLNEDLKFVASPGTYITTLVLETVIAQHRYILNLGAVYSAAEVTVNGQAAGAAIFVPYQVDITDYLQSGANTITVEVTPLLRNRLLGKGLSGHPEYVQYVKGFMVNRNPVSSGLVGLVSIDVIE